MAGAGNGPFCPVDPSHGRMYSIDRGGNAASGFRCMHSAHGGNGRKFTDKEASGNYELTERDVTTVYERAAHDVIDGRSTMDQSVQAVAKHLKQPTSQVREALTIMIDAIKEKDTDMAEKKAAAKAKASAKPAKQAGERRRLAHVDGADFKSVLDEFGLSSKQAAEATGAAGMGSSATYIYILTHDGSSINLFEKFKDAIRTYVKTNKIKRVKATAVASEPAESPAEEADEAQESEVGSDEAEPVEV